MSEGDEVSGPLRYGAVNSNWTTVTLPGRVGKSLNRIDCNEKVSTKVVEHAKLKSEVMPRYLKPSASPSTRFSTRRSLRKRCVGHLPHVQRLWYTILLVPRYERECTSFPSLSLSTWRLSNFTVKNIRRRWEQEHA